MKKNNVSSYLILVLIIFILVLYFSLKDNYLDIINALKSVNIFYLLLGISFVFICKYLVAETTYLLAKKENKKVKRSKMFHICLIYPFFAGITPSSVGGETFEIFYLKDSGISTGKASNIVIQKFILYQIAVIFIDLTAIILELFTHIIPNTPLVSTLVILNLVVGLVGLALSYLLAYNKKFNHFIMKKGFKFLSKIKVIKNVDEKKEKLDNYLNNFDEGVDKLKKDKKLFIYLILVNIVSLLFFYLSAYPIALSMNIKNISILNIFVLITYVKMMSLLIVTPGNSGASEYSFVYLFASMINNSVIMAYMLIWRFVTYYIPLIVGGVLALFWKKGSIKSE